MFDRFCPSISTSTDTTLMHSSSYIDTNTGIDNRKSDFKLNEDLTNPPPRLHNPAFASFLRNPNLRKKISQMRDRNI